MSQRILSFILSLSLLFIMFAGVFSASASTVYLLEPDLLTGVYSDNSGYSDYVSKYNDYMYGKRAVQFYQRASNRLSPTMTIWIDSYGANLFFKSGQRYQIEIKLLSPRGATDPSWANWNPNIQGKWKPLIRLLEVNNPSTGYDKTFLPKGWKSNTWENVNMSNWCTYVYEFIPEKDCYWSDLIILYSSDYVQQNGARVSLCEDVVVRTLAPSFTNEEKGFFSGLIDSIFNFFSPILNWMVEAISGPINSVRSAVSSVASAIYPYFEPVLTPIKNTIQSIYNTVSGIAETVWNKFAGTLSNIKDGVTGLADKVRTKFNDIGESIWGFFSNPIQSIRDGINNFGNTIKSAFVPSSEWLMSYVNNQADWLSDKLGALYYPIDLVVDVLQRMQNLNVPEPVIKLPEIKFSIMGKQIKLMDGVNYNLKTEIQRIPEVANLHSLYLNMVDVILVFCLMRLAYIKLNAILGGVNR